MPALAGFAGHRREAAGVEPVAAAPSVAAAASAGKDLLRLLWPPTGCGPGARPEKSWQGVGSRTVTKPSSPVAVLRGLLLLPRRLAAELIWNATVTRALNSPLPHGGCPTVPSSSLGGDRRGHRHQHRQCCRQLLFVSSRARQERCFLVVPQDPKTKRFEVVATRHAREYRRAASFRAGSRSRPWRAETRVRTAMQTSFDTAAAAPPPRRPSSSRPRIFRRGGSLPATVPPILALAVAALLLAPPAARSRFRGPAVQCASGRASGQRRPPRGPGV